MITNLSEIDLSGLYTYTDYLTWRLNESVELIKGKIYAMSPAPRTVHQRISRNMNGLFYNLFRDKKCEFFAAPFDVRLQKNKELSESKNEIYSVVQPDICVVCDATKIDEFGCNGAPDLIVEILSPGNSNKELRLKFDLYEESGVLEYWIADPNLQTIHLFHLNTKGKYELLKIFINEDILNSVLFPSINIKMTDIFEK